MSQAYKFSASDAGNPTLSDTVNLSPQPTSFMVLASGTVKLTCRGDGVRDAAGNAVNPGQTLTLTNLPVGVEIRLRVLRFWSTGTTVAAGNILCFYEHV